LWNPARLDPAYPPIRGYGTNSEEFSVPVLSLARALPIQTYTDGLTHPVGALALDDKATTLVVASDKTLVVTDLVSARIKRRFQGHAARINAVAVTEGAEIFLSASYDATVRIWDGRASRSFEPIQTLKEAKDSVTCLHVDQNDGNAIIRAGSVDGTIRSYDLRKGQIRCDNVGSAITGMVQSNDGQCLAASCLDGTIRLVEVDTGELLNTYASHHDAGQYSLNCCLTADDATIVTGSEDGRVVLYDLVRAVPVQVLEGHTKPTCSVATHPMIENNSTVISASYDGTAVVWASDASYMRWQE
jgi:mitogen-activated protein kinase organizer 1